MTSTNQTSAILLLTTLTLLVATSSGCFFRNCPRGGKRGMSSIRNVAQRQCMSCMETGVCVGPTICCGPDIGCHIGTEQSRVCAKENESLTPCKVPGHRCGSEGNCVADGICCDSETCTMDANCKKNDQLKPELIDLLKRLLASKRSGNDSDNDAR